MATFTVERVDGFANLADDLRAALTMAEGVDFQGSTDWYSLLCTTALAVCEKPQLHVLRRDGAVAAALPLVLRESGYGFELGALTNFYTTRFIPALAADIDGENLAILLRSLRNHQPRAARINLAPIDRSGATYKLLHDALRRAGLVTFEYFCYGNWYLPVQQDSDTYMAARPGELRSTLRRMSQRLAKAGGRVEIIGPDGDVDGAIAAFTAVYGTSWKKPEPFPEFMPGLIRLCARKGWLRMGVAWLSGKPIAAQLWVVAGGKANIFKLAYDSAYANLSPGTVLTATLMRHVIDVDRVREVDYLTGDDAYKRAWMSHRRELWGLAAYDPRQVRGALLAAGEMAARLGRLVLPRSVRSSDA